MPGDGSGVHLVMMCHSDNRRTEAAPHRGDASSPGRYSEVAHLQYVLAHLLPMCPVYTRSPTGEGKSAVYIQGSGEGVCKWLMASGVQIFLARSCPACEQYLAEVGMPFAQFAGEAFGFAQQITVARQAGDAEGGVAGLSCAEQFARAAYGKVFFGDAEAVGSFAHDAQAALCGVTQRWLVHEQAVGLFAAAPDSTAQLVQLCEAEAFGVFDDHQGGVRG